MTFKSFAMTFKSPARRKSFVKRFKSITYTIFNYVKSLAMTFKSHEKPHESFVKRLKSHARLTKRIKSLAIYL